MRFLLLLYLTLVSGLAAGNQSVCYTDLGCIVVDSSWFSPQRPLNPLPLARDVINTTFALRTRQQQHDSNLRANDVSTITSSSFKASRPTKLTIHGYNHDGSDPWIVSMTQNLLTYGDFNVINVRWGGGAQPPYQQAVANARLVGLEIAFLINTLAGELGVKTADVHIIGFSLGAHIAGYAGQKITGLGRITGLDPAGPFFQYTPPFVRLDPSDAQFVDVLHTNGAYSDILIGKGLMQPLGHVDLYANGGMNQPNCGPHIEDFNLGCSHNKAHAIFNDTLVYSCQPVAYACNSYSDFKQGKCASCGSDNSKCSPVGISADSYPFRNMSGVKYFFETASSTPYCLYHYRITIQLASPSKARYFLNGLLTLNIVGSKGQLAYRVTSSRRTIQLIRGRPTVFLDVDSTNVGVVEKATINWEYIINMGNPLTFCGLLCNSALYVSSIEVSELNNYPESARLANTFKLCPSGAPFVIIGSGASASLSTAC